jgi:hypothetical protein
VISGLTDDETLSRCKDNLSRDLLKAVDGENALDLRQQPIQQAKISGRHADDRGRHLGQQRVLRQMNTTRSPVAF